MCTPNTISGSYTPMVVVFRRTMPLRRNGIGKRPTRVSPTLNLISGTCTTAGLVSRKTMSWRICGSTWGEAAMVAAFSKESLSIAADNYEESLSFVRRIVRDAIKLEKLAA